MENAKRIGGMCALAVALGVGMAVANTPAVASAAPDDTGKGSSSGESSPSNSSKHGPSEKPSDKRDDTNGHRRAPKKADESAASDTDASTERPGTRKRGSDDSRPASNSAPVKTSPKPAVTPVLSPFAGGAPDRSPIQNPAAFTLMAFARREFEPTRTVDRPADSVSTSAVDPGFISSTHGFFGLFSVTSAADPDDNHYVAFVLRTPFFTNVLTSGTDPEDNLEFGAASIGVAGHTVNTFISPFLTFSIAIPIEDPFAELFTELVRLGF